MRKGPTKWNWTQRDLLQLERDLQETSDAIAAVRKAMKGRKKSMISLREGYLAPIYGTTGAFETFSKLLTKLGEPLGLEIEGVNLFKRRLRYRLLSSATQSEPRKSGDARHKMKRPFMLDTAPRVED